MAINYQFKVEPEMLQVITSGKDETLEEVVNYSQAVITQAIEHQAKKILCDERKLEYSISVLETYKLAEMISREARHTARVAIVCQPKYMDSGKFFETVAANRGLIIAVTSDYEAAVQWLNEE